MFVKGCVGLIGMMCLEKAVLVCLMRTMKSESRILHTLFSHVDRIVKREQKSQRTCFEQNIHVYLADAFRSNLAFFI